MYICNARVIGHLNRSHLLICIKGIKDTEKTLYENDAKRRRKFSKNWKIFFNKLLKLTNLSLGYTFIKMRRI